MSPPVHSGYEKTATLICQDLHELIGNDEKHLFNYADVLDTVNEYRRAFHERPPGHAPCFRTFRRGPTGCEAGCTWPSIAHQLPIIIRNSPLSVAASSQSVAT